MGEPRKSNGVDDVLIRRILEAILLISDKPLLPAQIREVLGESFTDSKVKKLLGQLAADYDENQRGIRVVEVAGGFQYVTDPEVYDFVAKLNKRVRAIRLSKPSLEALSIIAYRQPLTRMEIEQIRGVDCSGVLETLLKPGFIKIVGRKEVVGRPLLYGTTREFLEHFGLKGLDGLPSLEEIQGEPGQLKEVAGIETAEAEHAQEEMTQEAPAAEESAQPEEAESVPEQAPEPEPAAAEEASEAAPAAVEQPPEEEIK